MSRPTCGFVALALLFTVACSADAPTSLSEPSAESKSARYAETYTDRGTYDFTLALNNICSNDEYVVLTGTVRWQVRYSLMFDDDGAPLRQIVSSSTTAENLRGIGTDGTEYLGSWVQEITDRQSITAVGADGATVVSRTKLISKGSTRDLHGVLHVHFTYNASGEMAVSFGSLEWTCSG
jgi:hypothetical protein